MERVNERVGSAPLAGGWETWDAFIPPRWRFTTGREDVGTLTTTGALRGFERLPDDVYEEDRSRVLFQLLYRKHPDWNEVKWQQPILGTLSDGRWACFFLTTGEYVVEAD